MKNGFFNKTTASILASVAFLFCNATCVSAMPYDPWHDFAYSGSNQPGYSTSNDSHYSTYIDYYTNTTPVNLSGYRVNPVTVAKNGVATTAAGYDSVYPYTTENAQEIVNNYNLTQNNWSGTTGYQSLVIPNSNYNVWHYSNYDYLTASEVKNLSNWYYPGYNNYNNYLTGYYYTGYYNGVYYYNGYPINISYVNNTANNVSNTTTLPQGNIKPPAVKITQNTTKSGSKVVNTKVENQKSPNSQQTTITSTAADGSTSTANVLTVDNKTYIILDYGQSCEVTLDTSILKTPYTNGCTVAYKTSDDSFMSISQDGKVCTITASDVKGCKTLITEVTYPDGHKIGYYTYVYVAQTPSKKTGVKIIDMT